MSWSFYATGKPAAVLNKAKADLAAIKCAEPEEAIKGKVAEIIETGLAAYPSTGAVTIVVHGSQSTTFDGAALNSLKLEITPIYNFVE